MMESALKSVNVEPDGNRYNTFAYYIYDCEMQQQLQQTPSQSILKPRLEASFADDTRDVFRMISYRGNFEKAQLLGSTSLASSEYYADFDLFEKVIESTNIPRAKLDVWNAFKAMMRLLERNPEVYFLDFKAGIDKDLFLSRPSFENPALVRRFYKERQMSGLITQQQMGEIEKLMTDPLNLYEYCRKLWTIRWTPKTIESGMTELSKGRRKTFLDAVDDKAVIKIDVAVYMNGTFVEFSNVFEIYAGKRPLNYTESNIVQAIRDSLDYYKHEKKWYKVLKRYFSIARIEKNVRPIELLTPFFNSNVGLVNRVRSALSTIVDMIGKGYKPMPKYRDSIQFNKQQLGSVFEFDLPSGTFDKLDDASRQRSPAKMADRLEKIVEELDDLVSQKAHEFILKNKIKL